MRYSALKLSDLEVLVFTKHLAVMIKAGIPLVEALENLTNDAKGNSKKIIAAVSNKVGAGESLVKSLSYASPSFDAVYLAMIGVGEESGTLDTTLQYLAEQLNKVHALRRKIKGALLYPSLVLGLMFVIAMSLSLFVLPKLTDFFAAFETELPLSTKILLWFANLMKNYGLLIVGGMIAIVFLLGMIMNLRWVKPWWHKVLLRLPYIGHMNSISSVTEVMRNLGILLSSGVPIVKAWDIIINATSNEFIKGQLTTVREEVITGSMIGETMRKKNIWTIPFIAQRMLSVGERTGKIDEMAIYLADYYEEELDAASKNLSTVLEPILLVIVGLMVAFLALAIISPIYQITGSIGG